MGEIADIVVAGEKVIKLVANHAGVEVKQGSYVSGFPRGFNGVGLEGGEMRKVLKPWKQRSDWYEFWSVDFDFSVGMKWLWGGSVNGAGQYVDKVTVTLDVAYLPVDLTVDVTAKFPDSGHDFTVGDGVLAGIPFTTDVEVKALFGQTVGWTKSLDCMVKGDGTWEMA